MLLLLVTARLDLKKQCDLNQGLFMLLFTLCKMVILIIRLKRIWSFLSEFSNFRSFQVSILLTVVTKIFVSNKDMMKASVERQESITMKML
jgi:hypothetical protein